MSCFVFCATASAVCCVCKSCVVFALLPAQCAQCAVCVSPVLCLHYCQRSVLCEDYNKSFVVFAQCTASAVCRAGATISPLIIILFFYFLLFLNQARAGLWPAHTWFLEIVSVRMSVCVCVCVSAPETINN